MIFDKMFDALTNSADKILEKEAIVRGLKYSEVKADVDAGRFVDGCRFGSKYAIVRNGKKSVLLPYNELFWVFAQENGSADRVNVNFVTIYQIIYQINDMSMTDVIDICKKILEFDRTVLFGYREEYAKLYNENIDDLRKIKRQFMIGDVLEDLKKDAEKEWSRNKHELKSSTESSVQTGIHVVEKIESVQKTATETVTAPIGEQETEKVSDRFDEIQERFMEAYKRLSEECDMDMPMQIEKALCEVAPEIGEHMKKFRHNAIYLCKKHTPDDGIPVGTSKIGGLPDLPPDIEYPTMTSFSFRRKGQKPEEAKLYPKTAMHLVMQINLYELAESGADTDGIFPKTGMLYLFWSGEMGDNIFNPEKKYIFVRTYEPELAHTSKIIWWDGDISTLRRTELPLTYFEYVDDEDNGRFDDICPEAMVSFSDFTEYRREDLLSIDGFCELDARNDFEFTDYGSKLLGVPRGVNIPYIGKDEMLFLQLSYNVGCVWSLFWIMKKQDFLARDFSDIHLEADCD
ncbi:DUF1963 domain-containing protein [Ruminococcus sp.]|uniref:DUF1963 domain-containing protein n=1 Tax=Ruminococcus sp. TaxID=41978 RepID=UPI0025DFA77D|nr:DUF1963 domain-containing protein [Ruminococcus sp.]